MVEVLIGLIEIWIIWTPVFFVAHFHAINVLMMLDLFIFAYF